MTTTSREASAQPRVSVCIAAYNAARFIHDALRSACGQTFEDLEVVVWDDGSSDETADLVRRFGDPRVRLVQSPDNRGHAAALNGAMRHSRGAYIKFLDADDALEPDCVERLVDLMDRHESVDVGLVGIRLEVEQADDMINERILPWMVRIQDYHAELRELGELIPGRVLFERHLQDGFAGNLIGGPTAVMIRRTRLEECGLCNVRARQVDLELWLRAMYDCDVGCVHADLARYRVHPASMTAGILAEERLWVDQLWRLEGLATIPDLWTRYPGLAAHRARRRREYLRGLYGLIRARRVRGRELAEAAAYFSYWARSAAGRPPRIVEPLQSRSRGPRRS